MNQRTLASWHYQLSLFLLIPGTALMLLIVGAALLTGKSGAIEMAPLAFCDEVVGVVLLFQYWAIRDGRLAPESARRWWWVSSVFNVVNVFPYLWIFDDEIELGWQIACAVWVGYLGLVALASAYGAVTAVSE